MSKYLSYAQFLKDQQNFKKSGKKSGDAFNTYDMPSHKYFKILFYFGDSSDEKSSLQLRTNDGLSSGLLAPTWEIFDGNNDKSDFYNYNSAWAYLKMNDENERADKLEQFVTLLSNISTYSPWYFQSIGGLSEAIERKVTEDRKFELGDTKKLTITCLPDAFDNRIETLLNLYRDVTWSWINKKEIIPVNLRKFDMAVYIFESPIANWHKSEDDNYDSLVESKNMTSYKMLEFHDCEFNYNSLKSGYSELNNQEGFSSTYTIEISYNDCYEIAYNELIMKYIGDVIATDTYETVMIDKFEMNTLDPISLNASISANDTLKNSLLDKLSDKSSDATSDIIPNMKTITSFGNLEDNNRYGFSRIREKPYLRYGFSRSKTKIEYEPGFISNAIGQVAGHLTADVKSFFKRAVLGNIHTFSLTQIRDQVSDLMEGNLIKTGMTVAQYIKSGQQRAAMKNKRAASGNIFSITDNTTKHKPSENIFN